MPPKRKTQTAVKVEDGEKIFKNIFSHSQFSAFYYVDMTVKKKSLLDSIPTVRDTHGP